MLFLLSADFFQIQLFQKKIQKYHQCHASFTIYLCISSLTLNKVDHSWADDINFYSKVGIITNNVM